MKKVFFLWLFLLPWALAQSQSFSNLGFEYWQRNEFPLCWPTSAVTVVPDSVVKLSGRYSLKAVRLPSDVEKSKSSYGLIFSDIASAYSYADLRNKKIEVSVQVKSEALDTALHVFAFIQMVDLMNPADNRIEFGNDAVGEGWVRSSASAVMKDMPAAPQLYMGVLMTGCGEIRLDDFRILVDGIAPVEVSPRVTPLTVAEKKWLKKNIIPVSGDWSIDQKRFGKNFRYCRLVGIGDNVHGSSSVVNLKNMAAKTLIRQNGFTVLAIEDSPVVGEALNRFIQGKEEVLRQDINVMYSNRDFESFMRWLRDYNRTAGNQVSIVGVDVNARYEELIQEVDKMTSGNYTAILDSIRTIIDRTVTVFKGKYMGKAPFSEAQKTYLAENLETIKQHVPAMGLGREREELLVYYIDNVLHYLICSKGERERLMAGNIKEWLTLHPDKKAIYLAHNMHVGNIDQGFYNELPPDKDGKAKSAGAWLKEFYKDQYRIIGTCYYEGTEMFKQRALASGRTTVINESVEGSYEHLFNQIGEKGFYLDLGRLRNRTSEASEWLTRPMLLRECGVEPFNYYYEFMLQNLTHGYDGVLFVRESVSL